MRLRKFLLVFVTLIVITPISGCLIVDDFGEYWQQGKINGDLIGSWHSGENNVPTIISKQDDYLIYIDNNTGKRRDNTEIKSIVFAGKSFLLMNSPDSKALFYYELDENSIKLFGPKKEEREQFYKYSITVEKFVALEKIGVRIKTLNEDVMKVITQSIDDGMWRKISTLKRSTESRPNISVDEIIKENQKNIDN